MQTIDLLEDDHVPWPDTVALTNSHYKRCIVTGRSVPTGDPTVKLVPPAEGGSSNNHYVSIGAVETLSARLTDRSLNSAERVELGEHVHAVDGGSLEWMHRRACVICREQIDRDARCVAVELEAGLGLWDAFLHPGCAPGLVEALDRVWEHAPWLLSETV